MSDNAGCPYCGKDNDINHDDGYGYGEDLYEQECSHCEKTFTYRTSISYYYDTYKADCMNGGEHKFKSRATCPVECTKMECVMCEMEREPTEEEWVTINESRKK